MCMTAEVLPSDPKANTFTAFDIPPRGSEMGCISL
jgi:hypothetical protein